MENKKTFLTAIHARYRVQAMPAFMQKLNAEFAKIMSKEEFHKLVIKDKGDYRDEDTDDEILSRAFDELYPDWMTDLERRGKFHGEHLEIYRGVSAKEFQDIDFKSLGVYWTWHKSWAANYSDQNTKLPLHVLTALVTINDIDLKETLRKIVWADIEESEREITLKPHAKIKIIDPIKREATARLTTSKI